MKSAPSVIDPVTPDGENKDAEKKALNAEEQAVARSVGWTDEQYIENTKGVK